MAVFVLEINFALGYRVATVNRQSALQKKITVTVKNDGKQLMTIAFPKKKTIAFRYLFSLMFSRVAVFAQ